MVMKGDWQFRDTCVCLKHRTRLSELWTEETPVRRFDVGARLEEMLEALLQEPINEPEFVPSAYDLWLDRRLASGHDPTWMAAIPLVAVTTTCGLLGGELLKLRREPPPDEIRHAQALAEGFDVLRNGTDAFRACLDDLALRADGALTEANRAFGTLYTRMAREFCNDPAFAEFRSVLRECILSNWPYAAGEVVLGETVAERRIHSVLTAARDIAMAPKTLDAILTGAGALAPSDHRPHSRKIFCAATSAPLLAEIPTWVGPGEMMEGIGATKRALATLEEDGILVPRTQAPKVIARWRMSDGLALLDELASLATRSDTSSGAWEGLQEAKKRKGVAVRHLIAQVRAGQLQLRRVRAVAGYNGFQVSVAEVNALAARLEQTQPYAPAFTGTTSAAAFGRKVGIRDGGHFLALIQAGHVIAQAVLNPRTHLTQFRMSEEDIAAFHKRFLTTTTMEDEFGVHRNRILAILRSAGAQQFTLDGQPVGPIWLRGDVEGILRSHAEARPADTTSSSKPH